MPSARADDWMRNRDLLADSPRTRDEFIELRLADAAAQAFVADFGRDGDQGVGPSCHGALSPDEHRLTET